MAGIVHLVITAVLALLLIWSTTFVIISTVAVIIVGIIIGAAVAAIVQWALRAALAHPVGCSCPDKFWGHAFI